MINYVVDTDGVSGDYSTLSASSSGLPASLGDNYTILCYASTGVIDTSVANLSGITLNGFTITIEDGNGTYELKVNSTFTALTIGVNDTTVNGLTIDNAGRRCIGVTADNCVIDGCTVTADNSYSSAYGIGFTGAGASNTAINNTIYGYGPLKLTQGIVVDNGHGDIYNNVVYNCVNYGVFISNDATATIKNNAVLDCGDDFFISGASTLDYNASDDGDGTNAVTPADWGDVFTDYPNFDFTLKTGSDLIDAGIGPAADANVPVLDKAGETRSGATTDIGAYLFVGGGIEINIQANITEPETITATLFTEQFLNPAVNDSESVTASIFAEQFLPSSITEPETIEANLFIDQYLIPSITEPETITATLTTSGGGLPHYERIQISFNIERSKTIPFDIETAKTISFDIETTKEVDFDI